MSTNPFEDAEIVSRYTRAQAIADGVLVDLTSWAKEVGFKYQVACTSAVWVSCIDAGPEPRGGQDERGRAHDVLWMLKVAIRKAPTLTERVGFKVKVDGRLQELYSVCGPGDTAEPVITIMEIGED